jgi:SPP1 family predicted phage head-tail adaptor
MRQLVTLQTATTTRGTVGQQTPTWSDAGTFFAQVKTLGGGEVVNARQVRAVNRYSVRLRYSGSLFANGVLPTMRLLFNGRILNVESATNTDERYREYVLTCTEVANVT